MNQAPKIILQKYFTPTLILPPQGGGNCRNGFGESNPYNLNPITLTLSLQGRGNKDIDRWDNLS